MRPLVSAWVHGSRLARPTIASAWINFNGEGTVSILASHNVSALTDNGVGDYTITWDRDFRTAHYAAAGIVRATPDADTYIAVNATDGLAAGSMRLLVGETQDSGIVCVAAWSLP